MVGMRPACPVLTTETGMFWINCWAVVVKTWEDCGKMRLGMTSEDESSERFKVAAIIGLENYRS